MGDNVHIVLAMCGGFIAFLICTLNQPATHTSMQILCCWLFTIKLNANTRFCDRLLVVDSKATFRAFNRDILIDIFLSEESSCPC